MKTPFALPAVTLLFFLQAHALAQFDDYLWVFQDGQWGGGQSFVSGDQLFVELSPDCGFGILDEGWARTTVPRSGRFTFDFSANSLGCPGPGGFCNEAQLVAVAGPTDCSIYPFQGAPGCEYRVEAFNGGAPYFANEGVKFVDGSWAIDVEVGDQLKIGASTAAFTEDCRILATFSNLAFQPVFESSASEVSLSTGGSVNLNLTVPQGLAGLPYLVLGSASGTQPGLAVDGFTLPLNIDAYFLLTLSSPGASPLSPAFGLLDSAAQAQVDFDLPPAVSPALAGLELHHAGLILDTSSGSTPTVAFVTPALALDLLP